MILMYACLWTLVILLIVSVAYINNFLTGNIFISRTSIPNAASEDGDEDEWISNKVIFKIGKKERYSDYYYKIKRGAVVF